MKQLSYLFLCVIMLSLCCQACKKDNGAKPLKRHEIVYKVTSNNDTSFNNISYTDSSGSLSSPSLSDFNSSFSQTVYPSFKPFTAQLSVQGQNNTGHTIMYTLEIDIDNVEQSFESDSASKFSSFSSQVSAILE